MRKPAPFPASFLPIGFETAAQVEWRRRQLVGYLRRSADPNANALARDIDQCAQLQPCGSGACPACQRTTRIGLLRDVHRLFRGCPLLRLSWIPCGGRVPVGQLANFDLKLFLASRQRALQRALPGVRAIFGGADVSLNTFDNGSAEWQVHVYLIILGHDSADLRRRVLQRCPGEPTAPRPIHFREVVDPAEALSYAVKAVVLRRSSYVDREGRRNARSQALSAQHAVEAALYQERWPMRRRLLLCGLRIVDRVDGLRLVRLSRRGSRC